MPRTLIAVLALVLAAAAPPAGAQSHTPVDAQKIIDACWAISQELRDTGNTSAMRSGTAKTLRCLEDAILDQVDVLFTPDILDREEAQRRLDQLRRGLQKLYWDIHNNHKGCWCGTFYQDFHLWAHADVLEKMLKEMVAKRNEYKISPR